MKAVILGCIAALTLAYGVSLLQDTVAIDVSTAYATEGVRLDAAH